MGVGGGCRGGGGGSARIGGRGVGPGRERRRGNECEQRAHALDGGDEGRVWGDVDCFGGGGVRGGDGGVEEGAFG